MNKLPLKKLSIINLLKKIPTFNLGSEKISLDKSIGRFLAEDLVSKINLPPFKNSAVDGYALNRKDILHNKSSLILTQRITAGDKNIKNLKIGKAARIFTGAKMPSNSDTVVMQENVSCFNEKIRINKMPSNGENCRHAGEDISKGDKIMSLGDTIDSTNINFIAAIGKINISLQKKLNVGFYTSGNELINPTEKLKGSQINNSNYYSLKALLNKPYIKSKYLGILKDKESIIKKSLLKKVNKYNVIITTGGASVGEEDHLVKIINQLGKVYFWKAAIKPGRPLAIGKIKNTIIICLPGNPVSVHLLYGMIIKPFLEYLCRGILIMPKGVLAKTNFSMNKKNKRMEWLRVNIHKNKDELVVNKYPKQGSGMISSIVYSDGIIEIPEDIKSISKNDHFKFFSFNDLFD